MTRTLWKVSVSLTCMLASLPGPLLAVKQDETPISARSDGTLALAFVPNAGQTDPRVRYSTRDAGAAFYFAPGEVVLAFTKGTKGHALQLAFPGADPAVEPTGVRRGPGSVNYLIGNDPARWRTGLPTYGEVLYRDLWPGIDLAFRGEQGELKYEFRVAPGADPHHIRLAYRGISRLGLGEDGDLQIHTASGVLHDSRPVSYQEIRGQRVPIASRYTLVGHSYGFATGSYDRSHPLVVDPGLDYSTYLGGSGFEEARDIALDAAGNAYLTGQFNADFPATAGAFDTTFAGSGEVFVTKLDPSGNLVYSTYLGGSQSEFGTGIAVDSSGSAHVMGITGSPDFPTTAGALDTTLNSLDIFVTKLNPSGSALEYSTFLGGPGSAGQAIGGFNNDIAVDALGSAYVSGITDFGDFPVTPVAFDTTPNSTQDGFVAKLNPSGSALEYSTYLGGSGSNWPLALAVDGSGSAYVAGLTTSTNFPVTAGAFDTTTRGGFEDGFVTKLNPAGSALEYSTFLGGEDDDQVNSIAVDASGNAYVTGTTESSDFPVTSCAFDEIRSGPQDVFVTKLNPTGTALEYSTYLGGNAPPNHFDNDGGLGIAVDASGSVHVTGTTTAPDFPTTPDAFDATIDGSGDVFVTRLNASGTVTHSSFLGGSGEDLPLDIALDGAGAAYVAGRTSSSNFPVTPGAFDETFGGGSFDAFVTKMSLPPEPPEAPVPAALQLTPPSAQSLVGPSHTVTASVEDQFGDPFPNVTVRFSVTGATTASGSCPTDASGQCQFSYQGPTTRGSDTIAAFADRDADGVADACEPSATATRIWLSAADDFASTDEDSAVTIAVLANDGDPNEITLRSVTQGTHGSVAINPDDTVTYSPAADFNGEDSFTYTVEDTSDNTDTATVTVFVRPVNDPPVAHDGSAATDEDVPVQISLTATDVEGSDLEFVIVSMPSHGTLGAVNGSSVVYTPGQNFNGPDSFTFKAREVVSEPPPDGPDFTGDGADFHVEGNNVPPESNVATVSIAVAPMNDAPVAVGDSAATSQARPVRVAVLANDFDPDGDPLAVVSITQGRRGATALNGDGTVIYTPAQGFTGTDSFTYSIEDGHAGAASATVTVRVRPGSR